MSAHSSLDIHASPTESPIQRSRRLAAEAELDRPRLVEEARRAALDEAAREAFGREWDDGVAALDAALVPVFHGQAPVKDDILETLTRMGSLIAEADVRSKFARDQQRVLPAGSDDTWNGAAGRVQRLRAFPGLADDLARSEHGRAAVFAADLLVGAIDGRESLAADVDHLLAPNTRPAFGWVRHLLDRLRNVGSALAFGFASLARNPHRPMRLAVEGDWRKIHLSGQAEAQVHQIVNGGDFGWDRNLFWYLPKPSHCARDDGDVTESVAEVPPDHASGSEVESGCTPAAQPVAEESLTPDGPFELDGKWFVGWAGVATPVDESVSLRFLVAMWPPDGNACRPVLDMWRQVARTGGNPRPGAGWVKNRRREVNHLLGECSIPFVVEHNAATRCFVWKPVSQRTAIRKTVSRK